jgi:hypothetical protein
MIPPLVRRSGPFLSRHGRCVRLFATQEVP